MADFLLKVKLRITFHATGFEYIAHILVAEHGLTSLEISIFTYLGKHSDNMSNKEKFS